ncbi:HOOK-domain-containing protein [Gigaspora margarita]|uniref:HOOK-domain-containing protein n=1 Tax=Gigaspora margarita TaxID=4874 RepID=A0A8H4EV84_GIGMA|nr:HOOK-domain-containing protein [Gigaspora margarita]
MEEAGDLSAMGQDDNRLKKAVEVSEKYRQKLESAEAHVKKTCRSTRCACDSKLLYTMKRYNSNFMLTNFHLLFLLIVIFRLQNETIVVLKEERDGLKKELEDMKHVTDKLKKSENVIELYRKKLENTVDIRRTLKAMEQENRQLVERNQMVEDEYRKVANYKSLMENYKKQTDALQIEKTALITQLELEKSMRLKIEVAHSRDMETIRLLEDRVRELELEDRVREMELGDGEPPLLDDDKTEVKEYTSFGEISHASKGSTITSLRIKVLELERELTRLRESKPADGNADAELLILQNILEDANRAKLKLEKDYDRVQKEKLSLESELRLQQNV